jgi:transcriptional regulator with XRE-family HTH domain
MNWESIVGKNIRRLRKARGLTQEQLAEEAGMAMRYLSGVERGEENPTLRFLVMIADALGVQPAELLKK